VSQVLAALDKQVTAAASEASDEIVSSPQQ
jgi:hypothetical protein